MQTTVTRVQVEQLIYRCRMRQLHAEQFGTPTAAETYRLAADRWLELWPAASMDGAIRI